MFINIEDNFRMSKIIFITSSLHDPEVHRYVSTIEFLKINYTVTQKIIYEAESNKKKKVLH